jgi:sulfate adenylyltransferase subunit 2
VAALQQPHRAGETIRVFPLSNWTERDVWEYVEREGVEVPSLYFAAPRPTVEREGQIFVVEDERFPLREGERPAERTVRFRTLGCYPLSGAMLSEAATVPAILEEMARSRSSERQGRVIDRDQQSSMERKKRDGYF